MSVGARVGEEFDDDELWRIVKDDAGRFHVQRLDPDDTEDWVERGTFDDLETAKSYIENMRSRSDRIVGTVVWES